MSTFVLVHGGWHDGFAWEPVIKHLEAQGHQAFAPTIAGHGKGVNKNVNHAQCTQSIVDYIVGQDLIDIVLLGHSFGGTIIAKVAEAIGDPRIRRLIFFNAFVLNDGESLRDNAPPHFQVLFDTLVRESGDQTIMIPFEIWREAFINDADLELAKSSYAQLSPEPYQPLIDKLDLKQFYALTIPKSYLYCTEDTASPQGEWGWHPRMSNRLGLFRFVQMPGSHEVMFSNPVGLAEKNYRSRARLGLKGSVAKMIVSSQSSLKSDAGIVAFHIREPSNQEQCKAEIPIVTAITHQLDRSDLMMQSFWFFGSCLTILADHTTTRGQYDLIEGYLPPGSQTSLHRHTRYSEQFYVLEGEFTVWVGENKVILSTGESFLIPVGTPHVVAVIGDQPAHGLVIAAPSAFARLVAAVGTENKNDAPDMALFDRTSTEIGDKILGSPGTLPSTATKT